MNVNNRKLFANRDARRRLADMGGIVASSPELLGAAQQFQEGGIATPYERAVGQLYTMDRGQLREAGMPRFAGTAMGYLGSDRAMEMLQNIDPNIGPEEFSQMSPQERRDAGFSSSGLINRQYFDVRNNIMESQFPMQGPEMPAPEAAPRSPEDFVNPVDEFPEEMGQPRESEPTVLQPEETPSPEPEPEETTSAIQEVEQAIEGSDDPNAAAAAAALRNLGGTETEGFDLGSVEGRISAYEELFTRMLGESDEEKRREKYMNLAMIGFAIAAGEDPNALKNIADGLLAGTAQMAESNAARRERENRISELAIQAGIGDERALAAAAEDPVTWIETPQGEATVGLYEKLTTERNLSHEDAIAALNSITPGLGDTYQLAMSVGVVPPPAQEELDTSSTAITISTQEEYDALPSGSVYIDAETGRSATKP